MGIDKVKMIRFSLEENMLGTQVKLSENSQTTKDIIPFKIKRIFYMYDSDTSISRGNHANRYSEFVLMNMYGTSKVKVSDGTMEKIFYLNSPSEGLYIPPMVWKEMYDFSEGSVLLCLSSREYDQEEYIRDYSEFMSVLKADVDKSMRGRE